MRQKAISLWEPWASLVIKGLKRFETRGRPTKYRGPLTIHAARKWNRQLYSLCQNEPFNQVIPAIGMLRAKAALPLGCALGTVELVDVLPVEAVKDKISPQELAVGNYSPGRFAWKLENPKPFPKPIPVLGRQGFFYIEFHCGACQAAVELLVPLNGQWVCEACWSEEG